MNNDALIQKYIHDITVQLSQLDQQCHLIAKDIDSLNAIQPEFINSGLDMYDYLVSITAGVIGGIFSSSKTIENYLHQIHEISVSGGKGDFLQTMMAKLVKHQNDWLDIPANADTFIKRDGSLSGHLHRLYFGHDIFSVIGDNPFTLSIKQYGLLKGISQTVRHLAADTFSKTGLPLPGSSFFDYRDSDTLKNWFDTWAKQIKSQTDTDLSVQAIFGRVFSIRMQDIVSQGLTWAIIESYIKVKKIEDKICQSQMKLIGYTTCFVTTMLTGYIKYGIPCINWPALGLLVKEFYKFLKLNYEEIRRLEQITNEIVSKNILIEQEVFHNAKSLLSYEHPLDYINELNDNYAAFKRLNLFLEEEE